MTTGLAATTVANALLNALRGTAFTTVSTTFVKIHIGDPGSAGTANASVVTTRPSITFSAASSGAIALSNSPAITATATETWTHYSIWDASTAGNFLWSGALTTPKSVVNTDVGTFTSNSLSFTPLAA